MKTTLTSPLVLEKIPPYKDRFRILHDKNQAAIKKNKYIEKRNLAKDIQEKNLQELRNEKLIAIENNERWKRLNII